MDTGPSAASSSLGIGPSWCTVIMGAESSDVKMSDFKDLIVVGSRLPRLVSMYISRQETVRKYNISIDRQRILQAASRLFASRFRAFVCSNRTHVEEFVAGYRLLGRVVKSWDRTIMGYGHYGN
jgi:hypothetical protein